MERIFCLESHLHGLDNETGPLDWGAEMKIAPGLAYLHDFTPEVSDFGLARTALDEENKYVSIFITILYHFCFSYLAPEYAMVRSPSCQKRCLQLRCGPTRGSGNRIHVRAAIVLLRAKLFKH
ncbi:hypothetical protein HRI_003040300 [Hibiscus trionum]|uniref:Protein kinase domain-containing protein n=1 Tax=Hibiscus trionum TaxID=183268 RepID=A0A9W7MCX4_HIBTR|nr:hypothetical protein HRI_003040300 [Hibiscus trionum]